MPFPKPLPKALEKRQDTRDERREDRALKADIKARDGFRCRCCGRRDELEVHERKTRGAGGKVSRANSLTLDRVCHRLAQQYRILIEGKTCEGPLTFTMGAKIAAALFDRVPVPKHVHVVAEGV